MTTAKKQRLDRLMATMTQEKMLLETVIESINTQVVYLDRDFNFTMVNGAYAEASGHRREELMGRNHFDLFPHPENEAIFRRVRDSGVAESYHDKPFVFPDRPERGVTYWDWTLSPVASPSGQVEGLVFSLTETTQRVRANNIMQQASQVLEDKVKERTADLENLNLKLGVEVERRTLTEAELRSLSRRLVEAQEAERRLISMELHDEIGQRLTMLKMILDTMLRNPGAVSQAGIKNASEQVSQVIAQVRNLSMQLHPSMLEVLGLEPTLRALFDRLHAQNGLDVEFRSNIDNSRLDQDSRLCAYRVVQEALTNVMRYAGVNAAQVTLKDTGDRFLIAIQDDGRGFDLTKFSIGQSNGISGMRERATTLNGNFQVESAIGHGTSIEIDLPYAASNEG